MKEHSQEDNRLRELRQKLSGFGVSSHRKTYYPALRQSNKQLEWFRLIIDELDDVIVITDSDGSIQDMNRTARQCCARKLEDVIGSPIDSILSAFSLSKKSGK